MSTLVAPARRPRRRWIVPLLVIAGLVGIIALTGGFRSGGNLQHFEPGDTVDLDPMNVVVTEARAMQGFDKLWVVRVYGHCQMIEAGSMSFFDRTEWLFAVASNTPTPRIIGQPSRVILDPDDPVGQRRLQLAGGLPPMECAFESAMPAGFDPSTGILFSLIGMEWRDPSILQNEGETWSSSQESFRTELPVAVIDHF